MAGISITGLGSGLEVDSIISKLMQVEAAPRGRLELRQTQAKAREDALRDIGSKLQSVSDAATALRSASLWAEVQSVATSSPAVSARLLSGAGPGGYAVEVGQLARAEQRTFAFTASASPSQLTVNGVEIELAAGAYLADAVSAINAEPETGVFAVASGGKLVLAARKTGAANTISASGAAIAEEAAKLRPGLDAEYSVDGVAGSSESNVVTDAVPGLELTLAAVTKEAVTVSVGNPGADRGAIAGRVKEFVSAYNSALDAIRSRLAEPRPAQAASAAEAKQGVLFGDSQLGGLVTRLRQAVAESAVGDLGVGTGKPNPAVSADSDSVAGRLAFDESKLASALEAGPAAARATLAGFSEAVTGVLAPVTGSGGTIAGRIESAGSENKRLRESMTTLDARLERREERLRMQFAALESALSRNRTQSAWLGGQLAQLGSAR